MRHDSLTLEDMQREQRSGGKLESATYTYTYRERERGREREKKRERERDSQPAR